MNINGLLYETCSAKESLSQYLHSSKDDCIYIITLDPVTIIGSTIFFLDFSDFNNPLIIFKLRNMSLV